MASSTMIREPLSGATRARLAQGTGPSPSVPEVLVEVKAPKLTGEACQVLGTGCQQSVPILDFLLKLSPSIALRPLRLRISLPSMRISATQRTSLGSMPISEV